jgi:hypothetical protein
VAAAPAVVTPTKFSTDVWQKSKISCSLFFICESILRCAVGLKKERKKTAHQVFCVDLVVIERFLKHNEFVYPQQKHHQEKIQGGTRINATQHWRTQHDNECVDNRFEAWREKVRHELESSPCHPQSSLQTRTNRWRGHAHVTQHPQRGTLTKFGHARPTRFSLATRRRAALTHANETRLSTPLDSRVRTRPQYPSFSRSQLATPPSTRPNILIVVNWLLLFFLFRAHKTDQFFFLSTENTESLQPPRGIRFGTRQTTEKKINRDE